MPKGGAPKRRSEAAMKSLEDVIQAAGNPVDLLRHSPSGPNVYPACRPSTPTGATSSRPGRRPACCSTCRSNGGPVVEGRATAAPRPGDQQLQEGLARARRAVRAGSYDGDVIGDGSCSTRRRQYDLVGCIPALNWITYHASTSRRRRGRARRALGGAQGAVQPQVLPLPDPGSERDEDHGEGARREAAGSEVLPRHHALAGSR